MHEVCYTCHSDADEDCELCHGRDPEDLFDHATTGWALEVYHQGNQCSDCHHDPGKYKANDPRCVTCHYDGFPTDFDHSVTGVEFDEEHSDLDCSDCHINGLGTTAVCEECHDDNRKWDPKRGFSEE
jgi:DnaJ-class molecular chaperone